MLGTSLSVLAATIVAPSLPAMLAVFRDVPNSDLLVRLVLTTPALFIAVGSPVSAIMSGFTTLIIDYFQDTELDRYMGYQSAFISFGGMGFLFIGGLLTDINWRLVFFIHLLAACSCRSPWPHSRLPGCSFS